MPNWVAASKNMVKNMILFGISILVLSLFMEGVIRLAGVGKVYGFHQFIQPSRVLYNTLIPNASSRYISPQGEFDVKISINGIGLRDREYDLEKPDGVFRILVIGDSPVIGLEVPSESTYPNQLERMLNEKEPGRYEVLNGGMSGYSPILYYLFLKKKGLSLNPDLVLVNFSITDVTDDYDFARYATFDEHGLPIAVRKPVQLEDQVSIVPFKQFLRNHSVLYHFLRGRYHRLLYRIKTWEARTAGAGKTPPELVHKDSEFEQALAPNLAHIQKRDLRQNYFAIFHEKFTPEEEKAWKQTRRFLTGIRQLCRERNIPVVLIPIPEPNQVGPEEWKEGKQRWGFGADDMITSPYFQRRIEAFGKEEGIPVVNPLPGFRQASLRKRLFYPYDGHFNTDGHRLMAEEVFQGLEGLHVLPDPDKGQTTP